MALTKSQFDELYEKAKAQDKNIRNTGSTPENVKTVSQKRFDRIYRDVQKEMQQGSVSPAVSVKPDVKNVYRQNLTQPDIQLPKMKTVKLPSVVENQGLYYAPGNKKNVLGAFGEGLAEGVKGFGSGVANVSDTLKSITRPAGELNRQLQGTYYDAGKSADVKGITENVVKQYGVNSRFNKDIQQNIKQRGQKQAENLAALYEKYADVPMSDIAINAGQGVGNLLPSMAMNAATGGALGSAVFGTGVFGNAMGEALSSGATQDQAMMYAAADTALEVGIEKLFGGIPFLGEGKINVKGLTDKYLKTAAGQFLANRLADITGEGIEEVASGIIEPFLKRAFYDEDAQAASLKELVSAFGNGALVSAILGVANFGGNVAEYREIKDKVVNDRAAKNKDFTLSETVKPATATKTVRDNNTDLQPETDTDSQNNNLHVVTIDDIGQKAAQSVNVTGGSNMNVADYFRVKRLARGTDRYTYTDKFKEYLSVVNNSEAVEKILSAENPYTKTSIAVEIEKAVDNGGSIEDINGTPFLVYRREDGRTYNIELNKTGLKFANWLMEGKKSGVKETTSAEQRQDFEEKAAKIRPDHNVERIKKPKTIADKNTNALMDGVTEFTTNRKYDVQGYNRAQREQIKDELIAGLDTDNEKTTVNVEGDGTLNLVNNEKAVGTVLAKLGYKTVEHAEQTTETKENAAAENPYGNAKVIGQRGNVDILDSVPEGWKRFDMQTAPVGYVGVTNNKSLFGGERKHALVAEDVFRNGSHIIETSETVTTTQGKTLENSFYTPSYEEVIKKTDVEIIDIEIPTSDKMDNEDFDKWEKELVSATKKAPWFNKILKNKDADYENKYGTLEGRVSSSTIKKNISYKGVDGKYQRALLKKLDKVFENAVVIHSKPDEKGGNTVSKIHTLLSAVRFSDGKIGIIKLNVKEYYPKNQTNKIHENKILEIKNDLGLIDGLPSVKMEMTISPKSSKISVAELIKSVKNTEYFPTENDTVNAVSTENNVSLPENSLDEYVENLSPIQKARVKKTLSVELKDDSGKIVTRAKWVEDKVSADGNADNFVINRYKKAVPDGTKKTIDNAFISANENMVKQKCGSYWVDNRETRAFMKNPMDKKRREAAKKSVLENAALVKVEYGYKNPDNSTAVLTKTEYDYAKHLGKNLPDSIGAMKSGYYAAIEEYGAFPEGEKATNPVDVPMSVDGQHGVTRGVRTIMEAAATKEDMLADFEKAVANGAFNYDINRDKPAVEKAVAYIEKYGFEQTLNEWNKKIAEQESLTKDDMAKAQIMYASAVARNDYETAMKLATDISIEATRAGQVVQAMRLLKKTTPEGRLYHAQRSVEAIQEEINEKYGDKAVVIEVPQTMKDAIKNAQTTEDLQKATEAMQVHIAKQLPFSWSNFINSWRYLAMLGNTRTQVRNVLSNCIGTVAQEYTHFVQAAIEDTTRKGKADRTSTLKAPTRAQLDYAAKDYEAMKDSLAGKGKYKADSLSALQSMKNPFEIVGSWGKDGDNYVGLKGIFRKSGDKTMQVLSAWNNATNWAMDKGDQIFSERAYKRFFARYLAANNINPDNITNSQLFKARNWATKQALESVYRENNDFANAISRAESNWSKSDKLLKKAGGVALGGLMPFKSTPMNITKRAFEYTPAGIALETAQQVYVNKKSGQLYDIPEIINKAAKSLSGTSLIILGAYLAKAGILNGGLGDDKEDKMKKQMGQQAYAINIGDWSYTLDWGGSGMMPLFVGADIYQNNSEDDDWLMNIGNALANAGSPIIETSMMTGFMDALQSMAYEDNEIKKVGTALASALSNYLGQIVPTLFGQVARAVDGTSRSSYTNAKGVFKPIAKTLQKMENKIPGLSKNNVPYMDVWGNDVKNVGGNPLGRLAYNMLSPGYAEKKSTDKVEKMLTDLYDKTGDTSVLPSNYTTYKRIGDETIRFTDKQYEQYTKEYGQTAYNILDDLSGDRSFKTMKDAYKAEVVEKVYKYSTAIASNEVVDKELETRQANQKKALEHGVSAYHVFGGLIEADEKGNRNGNLSKAEVINYIESLGEMSRTKKAYLFAALGNSNWKNPYI